MKHIRFEFLFKEDFPFLFFPFTPLMSFSAATTPGNVSAQGQPHRQCIFHGCSFECNATRSKDVTHLMALHVNRNHVARDVITFSNEESTALFTSFGLQVCKTCSQVFCRRKSHEKTCASDHVGQGRPAKRAR